jgi:hypothetical protein
MQPFLRLKVIHIMYYECAFVASGIQHAILPSVAWTALQYFSTLSQQRHDFRGEKIIEYKMRFLFSLQCVLETFSLNKELRELKSKMYIGLPVMCPMFLSHSKEN